MTTCKPLNNQQYSPTRPGKSLPKSNKKQPEKTKDIEHLTDLWICKTLSTLIFRKMILYAQIAAAVVLSCIALYFAINFTKGRKSKGLGSLVPPSIKTPITISLDPDDNPDWVTTKQAKKIILDFKKLGFKTGKAYIIPQMDNIKLLSLFYRDYMVAVYNDTKLGFWAEVGYQSENRSLYLVTNSPAGQEIKTHPKTKKIYKAGANAKDLYNTLKQEVENVWALAFTNENFSRSIERYYRRDTSWRNNEGGITIQEFKQKLKDANTKFKITKDDLRKVFLETKIDELFQWHDACLEEYKKASEQSDEDFRKIADKLIIVPKKTISEAYLEYLVNIEFIEEDVKEKLKEAFRKKSNIPMIFEMINSNLPKNNQAKKLWGLEHPLEADVYIYNEENEHAKDQVA